MSVVWSYHDVPNDANDAKKLLTELIKDVQSSSKPEFMWLIETSAEGIQTEINETELKILTHKEFGRAVQEEKYRVKLNRLKRDIRILGCIRMILVENEAEKFADFFSQYIKTKRLK